MGTLHIVSKSSRPFNGRIEAGQLLADELKVFRDTKAVVLGIPRGGVIVAHRAALELHADLDIVLSHKLGAPGNPELAIGAVIEDGTFFVKASIARQADADEHYIEREKAHQLQVISERVRRYRQVLPKLELKGRVVIVTDDGAATGSTMQVALWGVKRENPERIVAALPVAPEDTIERLSHDADETLCLRVPPSYTALSEFYSSFAQVDDEELMELLQQERTRRTRNETGHA